MSTYQELVMAQKEARQAQAAVIFWRFDVQQQERWQDRLFRMVDEVMVLRTIWITDAYYQSRA